MICLAKKPSAAAMSSWCGYASTTHVKTYIPDLEALQDELGTRVRGLHYKDSGPVPIVVTGDWDCTACTERIREEARRLVPLLGLTIPDSTPTVVTGCSSSVCPTRRPGGIVLHGSCTCPPDHIRRDAATWRKYALALEALLLKAP